MRREGVRQVVNNHRHTPYRPLQDHHRHVLLVLLGGGRYSDTLGNTLTVALDLRNTKRGEIIIIVTKCEQPMWNFTAVLHS